MTTPKYTSTFIFQMGPLDDDFHRLNDEIAERARRIPGFLGEEEWVNETTGIYSEVYYWRDMDALRQLVGMDTHQVAKGRHEEWIGRYRVVNAEVQSVYGDPTFGLELVGRDEVQGAWTDTAVGLDGNHAKIALLRTPDGHGQIELFEYLHPQAIPRDPIVPNEIGMHRVALAVDDLDAALAAAAKHGCHPLAASRPIRTSTASRTCAARAASSSCSPSSSRRRARPRTSAERHCPVSVTRRSCRARAEALAADPPRPPANRSYSRWRAPPRRTARAGCGRGRARRSRRSLASTRCRAR